MGGERVLMGEMPWSVLIKSSDGKVCGGTLIGKRHVITAAHCFWKNTDNKECTTMDMYEIEEVRRKMKVSVGGVCQRVDKDFNCTTDQLGKWINIESALYSMFFEKGCSGTKDIAFLKLAEPVPDGIHHICLPHLHDTDELFDSYVRLVSSGYGADRVKMTEEECIKDVENRQPDTFCTFERSERNVCHMRGTKIDEARQASGLCYRQMTKNLCNKFVVTAPRSMKNFSLLEHLT
ncbi:Ovochymase-2 [Parelaphostrongylus tenuis]|uniref:Ovochymase-2 n=1 Tax=Parelaphostrongylus tenuis TaxID=148309 RepID=A0AAD5QI29_PARTN|nr:Ovochymase-2 [Parelaphostrongylus tenuis]